jgi:hypothetical protein
MYDKRICYSTHFSRQMTKKYIVITNRFDGLKVLDLLNVQRVICLSAFIEIMSAKNLFCLMIQVNLSTSSIRSMLDQPV